MDIIKAYAVKNLCYIRAQKMVPSGIVLHSTGANNPYLKRYVDCPELLGVNVYGNHWNTPTPEGRKVCVHAFIGYDKNMNIRVAEILPLDICCWGVGSGSKGSYNYDPAYIQIEICEDNLSDVTYYKKAFGVAAEYCAHLCKLLNLPLDNIVSHAEAAQRGYGENHIDTGHWMKNFGETMNDFREQVKKTLDKTEDSSSNSFATKNKKLIQKGDLVSISAKAVYYDGHPIPEWVKNQRWYVKETPVGDRVVIDENTTKTHSICSPICADYLTVISQTASETSNNDLLNTECPYLVRIMVEDLNIRNNAGTNYQIVGNIHDKGVYTIIEERKGVGASLWGKLKSGAGWISLDFTSKL